MRIGEILIRRAAISTEQVEAVLEELSTTADAQRLGEALVARGLIPPFALVEALAEQFHCGCIERVHPELLDASLVVDLPVEYARSRELLPVRYQGGVALLAHDPVSALQADDLAVLLAQEPELLLTTPEQLHAAIEQCYMDQTALPGAMTDRPATGEAKLAAETRGARGADLLISSEEAPVTQMVNYLLLQALKMGASDIHLEPAPHALRLRYRIDGILYEQEPPPKHLEAQLVARLKVMGRMDIAEKRLPQDGVARVSLGDREVDVRISCIPVGEGERMVLRLLRHDTGLLPLTDLGMSLPTQERFRSVLAEPHGVVWVTGPTGSGKTTSLYAAIQELDRKRINILTIEDPVEYQLADIGQMAVKPRIGLTFARGLRHLLRQDPDVILVGETRDLETAEIVVQAALTGHLVFSTLHTNDALGSVLRLTDMGIDPFLVAESTRACLAQRLVRRLCPTCREAVPGQPDAPFKACGCSACREGYAGRVGLFELIRMDDSLRAAIRQQEGLDVLARLASVQGVHSLADDGMDRVRQGLTTFDELQHVLGQDGISG